MAVIGPDGVPGGEGHGGEPKVGEPQGPLEMGTGGERTCRPERLGGGGEPQGGPDREVRRPRGEACK